MIPVYKMDFLMLKPLKNCSCHLMYQWMGDRIYGGGLIIQTPRKFFSNKNMETYVTLKDGRFRLRNRSRNRFQILPIWSRNRNRNQLFLPYWNRSRNRNHNNGPESESEPESCIMESVHDSRITVNYDNYFSYFGFNMLSVWIGLQTQLVQYFILCYSMSPYGLTKWMFVWI